MVEPDWSGRELHFVGVGGAGMSGLALIANALGARVTGSDRAESSYMKRLHEHGIEPVIGHAPGNVPAGAEVVYSSAVAADNPERATATHQLHRADLLAEIAALRRCLAITGTHGKTTTAAMAVAALRGAGLDPSYVVGGELRCTGANAGWGTGEWIVIEADESDRSLLKFDPEIAVLTSAELDHHATYSSRLELERTLAQFMARAGERAVVWDRPGLRALCPPGAVPYDAVDPALGPEGSRFEWRGIEVRLPVPGAHNAINAAGALTASALAGADPERAAAALASFEGVRRRLELLGAAPSGAAVYDDYSHNPTKVAAAIAAVRTLAPRRLVAVFQPHLYSRTRALAREFGVALAGGGVALAGGGVALAGGGVALAGGGVALAGGGVALAGGGVALAGGGVALAGADSIVVLPVYPARERALDFPGVDGYLVAQAAADAAAGRPVAWMPGFDHARALLAETLCDGDACLLMGAGDIDSLARSLVAQT